jgi:hypothetical protein
MSSPAQFSNKPSGLFKPGQGRALLGLLLVAVGVVFLLREAGVLADDSNWWVIFLAVPGVMLTWSAFVRYQDSGMVDGAAIGEVVIGLLLLVLSAIFVFDPTWSFTRNWKLDQAFPLLRDANWEPIWQWGLVVVGALVAGWGYLRRTTGVMVFGAVLAVVGLVFILNISWDAVWPLALVALGIGVLFANMRRPA